MLEPYLERVERQRKQFTVYSRDGEPDVTEQLVTRNVSVEHRELPPGSPAAFVTIRENGAFAGAINLEDLRSLLAPPVVRPDDPEGLADGYRALLSVLDETLFAALDRRQLLATSREFEDRARRTGEGVLRVSFQSLSVFADQVDYYRRLAEETDLEIHIYGEPDWEPPDLENVTYHPDTDGALSPYWSVAFDGGSDETQACVLVARQRDEEYVGFWSYDPNLVEDVLATLESADE